MAAYAGLKPIIPKYNLCKDTPSGDGDVLLARWPLEITRHRILFQTRTLP